VISARRRWVAGVLLVTLGALASPGFVPIYDGFGQPDEPYRYVTRPAKAPKTAAATTGTVQTPVKAGLSVNGFSVATAESGPQFSLFVPAGGLATTGTRIVVTVTPQAVSDGPTATQVDGNVYEVKLDAGGAPVTLTAAAAISTLYLRSTSQKTPQPTMFFRATPTEAWTRLKTDAAGLDVRVASFRGQGQYVVAFEAVAAKKGGGAPVLPLVLVGILVLLVGVVLVVRLRAEATDPSE
jgi:hypothetical protein